MKQLQDTIQATVKKVFNIETTIELTRPDEQFGDYTTNVAMRLAGQLKRAPHDVAEELVAAIKPALGVDIKEATIAGSGFINLKLTDDALLAQAASAPKNKPTTYKSKAVVTEYSDPNPFKALHAGHLYTTIVGDAISSLIEAAGGVVHRVNFGGDVGLHVGKAMWAILGNDEQKALATVQALAKKPLHDRAVWIANQYTRGHTAYEDDSIAKERIQKVNKKVYDLHTNGDKTSAFARIYWTCRNWSYEYFDAFYEEFGVHPFEKYYPESTTTQQGITTVKTQLEHGVYEKSDGAVVFKGEPYGLHTRVFINSQGLPTYEAKDVGLLMAKWQDYHFDQSIVITAYEQQEYMAVMLKSVEQFAPELARASVHLTHGLVKLEGGVKMSSRMGNVLYANDLLQAAEAAAAALAGKPNKATAYAAIKYALLKPRMSGDIVYNPQESVSLEGNSGPYLQYAHARARSILAKAGKPQPTKTSSLDQFERSLARKISEYPEVLAKAAQELMPHHICTYLYELAQAFNRFYEHSRVIGDAREPQRVQLVGTYANVLKDGLKLLGIDAPERL